MSNESPNYRLSKTIIQQTPVSFTSNILNTETNEVWRAKVFDLQKIEYFQMMNVLEFNQEVFHFLKGSYNNSIYLQKCFTKNDKDYIVFQPWQVRLSDYINQNRNGLTDQQEVKTIIQEIMLSLCDIYAEDYMVLNLKPQNIVRVSSPDQGQLGWRIESLVYEYETYNLSQKWEYEFDYEWASNEQKLHRQNLDDNLKDQQIVWYMGVIALRLIYGSKFKINKNFKDTDLNFQDVKSKCLPQVYELIQKAVKANIKDRIPLKQFLQLNLFNDIQITKDVKQKFRSGNDMRIKKSISLKSSVLKKSSIKLNQLKMSIYKKLQLSKTAKLMIPTPKKPNITPDLSEAKAKIMFNQFRWILEKCFYFGEIKKYTQSAASLSETSIQDKTVIRYTYFKLAQINTKKLLNLLQKSKELQTFRQSQTSKEYYQQLLTAVRQDQKAEGKKPLIQQVSEYEKKLRLVDPKKLNILSGLQTQVRKLKEKVQNLKVTSEDLSQILSQINGKFFSFLKQYLESNDRTKIQNRGIKIRALCYFVFSSYLMLVRPVEKGEQNSLKQVLKNDFELYQKVYLKNRNLQQSVHVKFADETQFIRLCEYTDQAQESTLIANAQKILFSYFRTIRIEMKQIKKQIASNKQGQKKGNFLAIPNKIIK